MYEGAVIDLDGTVYRGRELLPGADDAIDQLRDRDVDLLFLSNNPVKSRTEYVDRLDRMGLAITSDEVASSGTITTQYLAENHAEDDLFVVGSSGLRAQFREAALNIVDDPDAADVLVASFYRGFDYDSLRDGLWALDAGAEFVGTDPDKVIPAEGGRNVPGSGAIIGALASMAERDPDHVMGKPSEDAVEMALENLDCDPEECFVVGDRLNTDIELGERAGMTTVLVLTGVTDREQLAESDIDPDYVLDSFADIGEIL